MVPRSAANPRPASRRWLAGLLASACLFGSGGCANYRIGNGTLYAPDVHTVYVPMIESDSFRRDLGERLTEAVIKEIELKTPFKVVGSPDAADSILAARLVQDTKRVIVENQNDDPRAIEMAVFAQVNWYNARRQPLGAVANIPLPPELRIGQTAPMLAEAGQSVALQQQQAIVRLAEQIVATMEEPW
ncbi:MAG TPA: LPS assembly lipoprotein LptE [Lacipirellulaceae bacterium]|nr:LPS assembly lipoprotein LptE [Lacipirellulaceae bacterium]HMP05548.1 LPS assembly lipoprotein LptE [Lacipirellulaceae bacterium]